MDTMVGTGVDLENLDIGFLGDFIAGASSTSETASVSSTDGGELSQQVQTTTPTPSSSSTSSSSALVTPVGTTTTKSNPTGVPIPILPTSSSKVPQSSNGQRSKVEWGIRLLFVFSLLGGFA